MDQETKSRLANEIADELTNYYNIAHEDVVDIVEVVIERLLPEVK